SFRMTIDIKDDNGDIKISTATTTTTTTTTDDKSIRDTHLLHYKISLAISMGTSLISITLYPAWKFAGLFVVLFVYSPGILM
ncbi:hypothetical protein HK099_002335, partial [Clydaea vesicula]